MQAQGEVMGIVCIRRQFRVITVVEYNYRPHDKSISTQSSGVERWLQGVRAAPSDTVQGMIPNMDV